ncbi:MAG: PAS domain-containing sensor histidine kinase [Bacteroidetes bacterium]|nr:MAG: PAS domain-containing sensor histidine kinase [Bacteroidota bacterium]
MWIRLFSNRLAFVRTVLGGMLLLVAGSTVTLVSLHPEYHDPIVIRVGLVGFLGLLLGFSFFHPKAGVYSDGVMHLGMTAYLAWSVWVLAANQLLAVYSLVCLVSLALMGLAFRQILPLLAFKGSYGLALLLVTFLVPEPEMPRDVMLVLILAAGGIGVTVHLNRIAITKALWKKVQDLSGVSAELKLSQANLKAIFDNSLQAQVLLDNALRVLDYNRQAEGLLCHLTGWNIKAGEPFQESMVREDIKALMQKDFERALMGEVVRVTRRLQAGKTMMALQFQYLPAVDADGNLHGVVFTAVDLTESETVKEKLENRERSLKALLYANPDMIFRLDQDGRCLDFKPAAGDSNHVRLDRIIGTNIKDAPMMAPLRLGLMEAITQALAYQSLQTWQYRMVFRGEVHQYEARIAPANQNEVVCIVRDVTSEHVAREKLAQNERNLRTLLNAIPNPIFFKNIDGAYISCNQAFETFIGYTQRELVGKTAFDIAPPELARVYHEADMKLIAEGGTHQYEAKVRDAHGRERDVLFCKAIVEGRPGQREGMVGVILDITERKQAMADLQAAKERAEAASRAKAEFLSVMSHEIRTPMNAVIGATNLLMDEQPRPDQVENLETLRFSAENLLVIINDILDYSKIEAGKVELEYRPVAFPDILARIQRSLRPKAEEKGLRLRIDISPELSQPLLFDSTRMSQILLNLANNALKFTHEGEVVLRALWQGLRDGKAQVRVEVQDTGIGISLEDQERIFETFTQANSATTRQYGGTGLGLTICKHLVHLHGGELKVHSSLGKGSSFYFDLDLEVPPQPVEQVAETPIGGASHASLQGVAILVVEDNIINQKIVSRFLKNWGMQVGVAENGLEGVAAVAQGAYELVLMDLQMPEMDGYEATAQIREMGPPKAGTPIIALTASAMIDVVDEVKVAGMDDFVTKPFDPSILKSKLESWLHIGRTRMAELAS